MKKRKLDALPQDFPEAVQSFAQGAQVYDSSCGDVARVYYCDTGYYIKTAPRGSLAGEAELSRVLFDKGLCPECVCYISRDRDYFVTRSAKGEDLTHYVDQPEKVCAILANALRKLHAQPVADVPVSEHYRQFMASANGDVQGGNYDEHVLLRRFPIASREEAWRIMQEGKELLRCDTLIHGDACLPNVMADSGMFIDMGLAGVGDKHIDLFWAIWSLQYNLKTDKYTDYFLDLYGRENVDEKVLQVVAAYEVFG